MLNLSILARTLHPRPLQSLHLYTSDLCTSTPQTQTIQPPDPSLLALSVPATIFSCTAFTPYIALCYIFSTSEGSTHLLSILIKCTLGFGRTRFTNKSSLMQDLLTSQFLLYTVKSVIHYMVKYRGALPFITVAKSKRYCKGVKSIASELTFSTKYFLLPDNTFYFLQL